ncbi:zinc finger protein 107-like [Anneissia japonica]|uniref:zinc finger protein 107-like n=1 Tax=Anneissia japonica TaxID=1529436 RepID=UPI001425890F|nr:zinc finger protein 107-like [Anneissia japonica]
MAEFEKIVQHNMEKNSEIGFEIDTCSDFSSTEESKGRPNETCVISVTTEYSVIENCHLNLFPVNIIHEEKNMNECNEVEKQFEMSGSSEKNIQTCKEVKYKCEHCGDYFNLINLKAHMGIKTEDAPLQFEQCGIQPLHECEHCEKKFKDSISLKSHMMMHKRDAPYKCGNKFKNG